MPPRTKTVTLRQAIQHMREGVVLTDAAGRIELVNPAFCRVTGYASEEVVGKNPKLLQSGRQDAAFYQAMWSAIARDGFWEGEIWNRKKDGEAYLEWLTISAIKDEGGGVAGYLGVFTDITGRKLSEERLARLAHHDALTDLPNRMLFRDRLEQALAQARRDRGSVAVLFMDLDRFKEVNDALGHSAGDLLLRETAERLKSCVRETDTVARLGGDEFTVLLPGADKESAAQVAGKVVEALSLPYMVEGRPVSLTASVGIALYPLHDAGVEGLLHLADEAMYRVKRTGRNAYWFYDPLLAALFPKGRPDR